VLFGGEGEGIGNHLGDTWTWDGTTWTQQHPATSPPARQEMGMSYDTAQSDVVLFGGEGQDNGNVLDDTWTWDGTDWTQEFPATSPPALDRMGMTYDAAHSQVVLFGGVDGGIHGDTWTWDGTTWTQQHPATSPDIRYGMGLTYDGVAGDVVLFGGWNDTDGAHADTWTWDGADWAEASPSTSPPARYQTAMADDAATGDAVLFGGSTFTSFLGDTWTWDGTAWARGIATRLRLSPRSGPPSTSVTVTGSGFDPYEHVTVTFVDSVNGETLLRTFATGGSGYFRGKVTIPFDATLGKQEIVAAGTVSGVTAQAKFTVT
jgi:hypothetical protein